MIGRKIIWTKKMDQFLIDNYNTMTNRELAAALNLTLTVTRTRLYKLGLKRMELEYWTKEQIQFLKNNYKKIGDVELAEIYDKKWFKKKGWTKHHIEKKRSQLKLNRSSEEIKQIMQRNIKCGRYSVSHWKRWDGRETEIGTVKTWHDKITGSYLVIKIDDTDPALISSGRILIGGYMYLSNYNYIKHIGPIKPGNRIIHKDGNNKNCSPENLESITLAEHGKRNLSKGVTELSDNYIIGIITFKNKEIREEVGKDKFLIDLKRKQLQLRRKANAASK